MKITLNHTEITAAITAHVASLGIPLRGKEVVLTGETDLSIEVSIEDATTGKVKKPRKTRITKQEKADLASKTEEETSEVEEAEEETSESTEDVAAQMEGKDKKSAKKKTAPKKKAGRKKRMFGSAE